MIFKIRISGNGGQGIKFLGSVFVKIAMRANYNATLSVDYTPSVRGGPIFCDIILSSEEISYPFCDNDANIFIALHQNGIERSIECLNKKTAIFLDANTIPNIDHLINNNLARRIPITKWADDHKIPKSANMICLGFLSKYLQDSAEITIKEEHFIEVLNNMSEKIKQTNLICFDLGKSLYDNLGVN